VSEGINRRSLLQGGLASSLLGTGSSLNPLNWGKKSTKPNIVLIMADDLGVECMNSYGGSSYSTPVLNALAADGTQFENCFSTPLCTPSRVQILTGRYPFRTSWNQLIDNRPRAKQYMNPFSETTFAGLLQDAGYATAVAGKWQLCHLADYPRHAKKCGFDEHLLWMWKDGNQRMPRYWDSVMWRNGKRFVPKAGKYAPDLCADFLIRFMERNSSGPFLAYFPMILPHGPHQPTPFDSPSIPRLKNNKRNFASMVNYMDNLVGRLVNALTRLGIRDNTLVMFTSDNGTKKTISSRQNGEWVQGAKSSLTDQGCHVPLIAHQPGVVPAGRRVHDLVDLSDFLPTLVDVAGAKLPDNVTIDGRSFAPRMMGQLQTERSWVYIELGRKRAIRDKRYKLYGDGRFYDLKRDRYEKRPLGSSADAGAMVARARLKWSLSQLK
jgi:arylsulfatase A